ncbi:MAG: TonB-dependent receptor [Gammaproteobacteria bacterium]|nr:TonB-dependent receptor [Gammaproteobacteria bacterium]
MRLSAGALALLAIPASALAVETPPESLEELGRMSLSELTHVEVTSVSKSPQTLSTAPAGIYVITQEEIHRSGLHSLPEILRLAPNLQVHQESSSGYEITARGLVGNPPDQAFSNKLLILIDGRSVYSPLFSGVFFDQLDVMSEDIERIEVIDGPGATLWGANAVNGVINIITRDAQSSTGTLLRAEGGDRTQSLAARYGASASDALSYRVYGTGFVRGSLEQSCAPQASSCTEGGSAQDHWSRAQAGFRTDWKSTLDSLTLQGDAYRGTEHQLGASEVALMGANVLGRWQHYSAYSLWQLQAYVDHSQTGHPVNGAAFVLTNYDVELQNNRLWGARTELVWGIGERLSDYHLETTPTLYFVPPHRWLDLTNVFVQGSYAVTPELKLTAGSKFEHDPYSGWSVMPDARLGWSPDSRNYVWLAASRAVRAPTPFDTDVRETVGGIVFLTGKPDFRTEKVTAFETGYRTEPSTWLNVSASVFYSLYDDLRSIEPASATVFLPIHWDNRIAGHTHGVVAWADVQVTPWWRLSPSVRTFRAALHFEPGASGLLPLSQAGDDPGSSWGLKSLLNLGPRVTLDGFLRHVENLPDPYAPEYTELDARLGWVVGKQAELSLHGTNLLHRRHLEFPAGYGAFIERGVALEARLSF